jgi:hypothetical protein
MHGWPSSMYWPIVCEHSRSIFSTKPQHNLPNLGLPLLQLPMHRSLSLLVALAHKNHSVLKDAYDKQPPTMPNAETPWLPFVAWLAWEQCTPG